MRIIYMYKPSVAYEELVEWLIKQEKKMQHITSDHPEYHNRYNYRLTRLHLQNSTDMLYHVDGDASCVLRILLYGIPKLQNGFFNILQFLKKSTCIEDRMLCLLLCSSCTCRNNIEKQIVNYLTDDQQSNLNTRLITAVKKAK